MTNGQQVLTSWKEIASYLGKGVRTVQRWEAELGLPVRRPGSDRHIVLAFPAELDEWARPKNHRSTTQVCNGNETNSVFNPQPVQKIHLVSNAAQNQTVIARIRRTRDLVHQMMEKARANREKTQKLLQQCESYRRRTDTARIA